MDRRSIDPGTRKAASSLGQAQGGRTPTGEGPALSAEECVRLANGVPEPFAYIGRDERYRFINQRYEEFLGVSRATAVGRHFGEVIGGEAYKQARPFVEQVLAGREVSFELRRSDPKGERWVSVAYRPDRTRDGVQGFFVLVTDITQRKLAEAAARQENDLNRAVLDTVGALVAVLDREGRIVRFNQSCEEVTGFPFEEVQGHSVWDLFVPPEQVEGVRAVFEELWAGNFPNEKEYEWLTKTGERRLIAWTHTSVLNADGTVQYVVGSGLDVTDQRRAESELLRNREELRGLNARLMSAQEEFSSRLARELHDGLGQRVATLALQVSGLRRQPLDAETEETFETIQTEIDRLAADIRNVSHQLHPMILQDLGLKAAIENECRQFKGHGIAMDCRIADLPESLSDEAQLALYRIVQEALANIARHASATSVSVALALRDDLLVLAVDDNGCGFDTVATAGKRSLGLTSMKERTHALGGRWLLESDPGKGTRLEVQIPVPT